MRKPAFMGSLWLRARFDVEYLGLALPTAPPGIAAESLMESDLDFIAASRQDRIIAEQIRRGPPEAAAVDRRAGSISSAGRSTSCRSYLSREIPYLTNRGGEALRALVTACVLDHDDITTLAFSIEGLKRVMAHGANASLDGKMLAARPARPGRQPAQALAPGGAGPAAGERPLPAALLPLVRPGQRARILRYLRRHRRAVRGWVKVVLGQGGDDPWATVQARMREVLLRTDLWSDQVLVLRAVQTLTMLDVQHSCDLVSSLGGYSRPDAEPAAPAGDQQTDLTSEDEACHLAGRERTRRSPFDEQ